MTENPVIVSRHGSLARLHLNRPKALNSLTLEMVRQLDAALTDIETDPGIATVLLTGEGERGLCAGGDIIALYESGKFRDGMAAQFWAEEYRLNARIARFAKPYVAFMDGITMGGGVGVSAHGSHRVVTERTRLAMPETGIGLFPDVGGTWILSKTPHEIGTYIGMTGVNCAAGDAIFAGFADYYVTSDRLDDLVAALANLPAGAGADAVTAAIQSISKPPPPCAFLKDSDEISVAFSAASVEEIFASLEQLQTEFAQKTLMTLSQKSPTSLKLALATIRAARSSNRLEDCLNREYAGILSTLDGADFYEGVRAAVIDKDRTPKWRPATLAEVALPDLTALAARYGTLFKT